MDTELERRVRLTRLVKAARELNERLGLEPPLNTKSSLEELEEEIRELADIVSPKDKFSAPTAVILRSLGIECSVLRGTYDVDEGLEEAGEDADSVSIEDGEDEEEAVVEAGEAKHFVNGSALGLDMTHPDIPDEEEIQVDEGPAPESVEALPEGKEAEPAKAELVEAEPIRPKGRGGKKASPPKSWKVSGDVSPTMLVTYMMLKGASVEDISRIATEYAKDKGLASWSRQRVMNHFYHMVRHYGFAPEKAEGGRMIRISPVRGTPSETVARKTLAASVQELVPDFHPPENVEFFRQDKEARSKR